MAIVSILLTVIILTVSVLMVLIVLMQRPKQEGLGAAFGGGMMDSALGAHTTDILQKSTTWLGIVFFISAIGLAMVKTREFRDSPSANVLEAVEEREPVMPDIPPEFLNEGDPGAPGGDLVIPDPAPAEGEADVPETPAAEGSADVAPAAEGETAAPAPAKSDQ